MLLSFMLGMRIEIPVPDPVETAYRDGRAIQEQQQAQQQVTDAERTADQMLELRDEGAVSSRGYPRDRVNPAWQPRKLPLES